MQSHPGQTPLLHPGGVPALLEPHGNFNPCWSLLLVPSSDLDTMVQRSPSPTRDPSPPGHCAVGGGRPLETTAGPPAQLPLEVSTAYQGYDSYIEDGLICLKHKIRNMEKRKVGLHS